MTLCLIKYSVHLRNLCKMKYKIIPLLSVNMIRRFVEAESYGDQMASLTTVSNVEKVSISLRHNNAQSIILLTNWKIILNIWLFTRESPSMLGSHRYVGHEQCNAIIAAASINHDLYSVGLLIDVGRCPSRVAGNYWHVQQRGQGTLQPAAR